jgi:hypothetical protein
MLFFYWKNVEEVYNTNLLSPGLTHYFYLWCASKQILHARSAADMETQKNGIKFLRMTFH